MLSSRKSDRKELLYQSSTATILAHPARVLLNCVSTNQPISSFADFAKRNAISFPTNLIRGTTIFFTQLTSMQSFPNYPNTASTMTGSMIATLLETPFIRKSNYCSQTAIKPPFTRFGILLSSYYLVREAGFTMAIVNHPNAPTWEHTLRFSMGVLTTSTVHKGIVLEATKDFGCQTQTSPTLKDGFGAFRMMAQGQYTHCAFIVPFKHPTNYFQQGANLAHIFFPPKVVAARALYLGIFKAGYILSKPENRQRLQAKLLPK